MPEPVNFSERRANTVWQVIETRSHVVMRDQRLDENLSPLVRHLDDITDTVCEALLVERDEMELKTHVWVYHPDVLRVPGASVRTQNHKTFYGTADAAGVHLVADHLAWDTPLVLDRVLHEVVHGIWGSLVGEAPSLLNEGIAAWMERQYTHEPHPRLLELDHGWKQAQRSGPGWLAPLMVNDGFWSAHADGLDVYAVGAFLTRAIVDRYGLETLAAIFRDTVYEDAHLANILQQHLGTSLADLEALG